MEQLQIESAAELRAWLAANHATRDSIWVVTWKKDSGRPYVGYDEIVDQCICFGWVDSLPRRLDEQRTMLRISPRNPKSNWSRVNKLRVAALMQAGLMQPQGLALVELARRNGTWDFLNDVEDLIIPPDLADALGRYPRASFYFERFPRSSKRGILEWIKMARTAATRAKRIELTASQAARNLKANHPKGRDAGPPEK